MSVTRSLSSRLVGAQVVAVLAVGGAGVVGAHALRTRDGADPQQLVAHVASRITTAGSFRSTYTLTANGPGLSVTLHGSGLTDTVRKLQSATFQVPPIGTLEVRQVGGTTYLHLPKGRTDSEGHHWVSVPAQAGGQFQGQDPVAVLRTMTDPAGVRDLGPAKVHGVATRHYTMRLDAAKVLAAAAPSNVPLPAGAAQQVKDIRTDLWLDGAHLPRRMTMAVEVSTVSIAFVFEFTDFGGHVDVAAPAASDVTTATDQAQLASALQGALLG